MTTLLVSIKVMPDSPDVNLDELQEKIKSTLESSGSENIKFEIEPVAFGLKAINASFNWPEEKDTSTYEDAVSNLENVSSMQTTDYRRAFG